MSAKVEAGVRFGRMKANAFEDVMQLRSPGTRGLFQTVQSLCKSVDPFRV